MIRSAAQTSVRYQIETTKAFRAKWWLRPGVKHFVLLIVPEQSHGATLRFLGTSLSSPDLGREGFPDELWL